MVSKKRLRSEKPAQTLMAFGITKRANRSIDEGIKSYTTLLLLFITIVNRMLQLWITDCKIVFTLF